MIPDLFLIKNYYGNYYRLNMEININKKVFLGKYAENGKIIIPLNNNDDVQYFQQWLSQKKGYYVKT